jgi:hypothetical protein
MNHVYAVAIHQDKEKDEDFFLLDLCDLDNVPISHSLEEEERLKSVHTIVFSEKGSEQLLWAVNNFLAQVQNDPDADHTEALGKLTQTIKAKNLQENLFSNLLSDAFASGRKSAR